MPHRPRVSRFDHAVFVPLRHQAPGRRSNPAGCAQCSKEADMKGADETREEAGERRADIKALIQMLDYVSGEAERCGFPKAAAFAELGRLDLEGDLRLI